MDLFKCWCVFGGEDDVLLCVLVVCVNGVL